MKFTVPGVPVPKGRPRLNRKTGTVYTPKDTVAYEEAVGWEAIAAGEKFGTFDVVVVTDFYFPRRNKADGDNCHKAVLDGLQKCGVIKNDSQVVHGEYSVYVDQTYSRTEVTIERANKVKTKCIYCGKEIERWPPYAKTPSVTTCEEHGDLPDLDVRG